MMLFSKILVLAPLLIGNLASGFNNGSNVNGLLVPSFTLEDLRTGTRNQELTRTLKTTGLLSIKIDSSLHRMVAMDGLCHCLQDPFWTSSRSDNGGVEGVDSVTLDDKSTGRTTIATATVGRSPLPLAGRDILENVCGEDTVNAMELLRDQVAHASDFFVQALDRLHQANPQFRLDTSGRDPLMRDSRGGSYQTLDSVVQAANHLEHFHYYHKDGSQGIDASESKALEWHTDAGLFLAFVPAWDCRSAGSSKDGSFWIKLPDGQEARAEFEDDSIAIMMGTGAEHWLKTSLGLQATRHAVEMKEGDARTWYGMMHLVPESSIIQESPVRTFGDMKDNMKMSRGNQRLFGDNGDNHAVTIGCGSAEELPSPEISRSPGSDLEVLSTPMRRRIQHVQDARACNNATNFFCWMQCLDIPNYRQAEGYVNEDYSLYCLDPGTLAQSGSQVSKAIEPCEGFVHNSNCMGVWQPTAPGVASQQVEFNVTIVEDDFYCFGGTSMYMDGFHWRHDTTCVIYLFPELVLSTQGKFLAACFGTIVFGVLVEFIISRRRQSISGFSAGYHRLVASAGFYGTQLTAGYVIMLVVMTYSIPLFLCCVIGLVSGHVLFNAQDALLKTYQVIEESNLDSTSQAGSKTDSNADNDEECADPQCDDGVPPCCSSKKQAKKKKEDDNYGVPEGSTPCCQNVL